ncbi:MAG: antitoxin, partial [Streptosporangiaceae bacterium]
MPDFSQFEDEAKNEAGEHSQQVDQGIEKAGQFADQETGNRFGSEIQKGEQEGENYLGGQNQNQPGQQQQSQ